MLSAESKVLLADGRYKRAAALKVGDAMYNPNNVMRANVITDVAHAPHKVTYYMLKHRNWYTPSKLLLTHQVLVHKATVDTADADNRNADVNINVASNIAVSDAKFVPAPNMSSSWRHACVHTPHFELDPTRAVPPPITPCYSLGYVLGTALASGTDATTLVLDDPASRMLLAAHFHTAFPKLAAPASTRSSSVIALDPAISGLLRAFQTDPIRIITGNSHSAQLLLGITDGIVHNSCANMHTQVSALAMECVYVIDMMLPARPLASPLQAFRQCSLDTTDVVRCSFEALCNTVVVLDNMVVALT